MGSAIGRHPGHLEVVSTPPPGETSDSMASVAGASAIQHKYDARRTPGRITHEFLILGLCKFFRWYNSGATDCDK